MAGVDDLGYGYNGEIRYHIAILDVDGSLYNEVNGFLRGRSDYGMGVVASCHTKEHVAQMIAANKPECVIFDASSLFRKRELTARLVSAWRRGARSADYPGPALIGAITAEDAGTFQVIQAWLEDNGITDGLERPAGTPDLVNLIAAACAERDKMNSGDVVKIHVERTIVQRGVSYGLIALAGKGGSGKSLLAANIAALLAFVGDQRVFLADYSDTLPTLAETMSMRRRVRDDLTDDLPSLSHLIMNLARPGQTKSLRELVQDQLTEGWKPAYHRDKGQLDCLFGHATHENQFDAERVKQPLTEQLRAALRALRAAYDTIIVDTGDSLLSVQHIAAYREAALVLIPVPPQEDAALATSHFVWDLFQALGWDYDRPETTVALVVNGAVPGAAVSERRLRAMMPPGIETWGSIDWDPEEIGKALTAKSLPVLYGDKSNFSRSLAGIVDAHIAPLRRETVEDRGGFLGRLMRRSA